MSSHEMAIFRRSANVESIHLGLSHFHAVRFAKQFRSQFSSRFLLFANRLRRDRSIYTSSWSADVRMINMYELMKENEAGDHGTIHTHHHHRCQAT